MKELSEYKILDATCGSRTILSLIAARRGSAPSTARTRTTYAREHIARSIRRNLKSENTRSGRGGGYDQTAAKANRARILQL